MATTSASSTDFRPTGLDDWQRGDILGSGNFGNVFKAQLVASGDIIAVKESKLNMQSEADRKFSETLQKELDIIKDLKHPHIVRCFGSGFKDEQLYVYLEYVAGGSLRSRLEEFGPLPNGPCRKATLGLLEGLTYLHGHKPCVVHRDVKAANILVEGAYHVKLADFGCSKRSDLTQSFAVVGSLPWSAPEIWQNVGHGKEQDIWSFACTLIEMVTAEMPWGKRAFDNPMHAIKTIAMGENTPPLPDVDSELLALMRRCLRRNPSERPSAAELLNDPFVAADSRPISVTPARPKSAGSDASTTLPSITSGSSSPNDLVEVHERR